MPREVSGRHTAAAAVLATFKFLLGIVCIGVGVLLVRYNTSDVQHALEVASNLPVQSTVVTDGLIPLIIISPQAIILPAIIGFIAAGSRKRCGYVAYLIFATLSSLWIPIQTAAALLFACCYAFVYAVHSNDSDRYLPDNLANIFLCLVGIFSASFVSWLLMVIGCIFSCCNTCCYERRGRLQEEQAPLLLRVANDNVYGAVPYETAHPHYVATVSDQPERGYAVMVTTGGGQPRGWQVERDSHRTSAAPLQDERVFARESAVSGEHQRQQQQRQGPARTQPPAYRLEAGAMELAATGQREWLRLVESENAQQPTYRHGASAAVGSQQPQESTNQRDPAPTAEVNLMKFDD